MNYEEYHQRNHNCIAEFIADTTEDKSNITTLTNAVIAQFLDSFKRKLRSEFSEDLIPNLSQEIIINIQIELLRQCIIDLQGLITKEVTQ